MAKRITLQVDRDGFTGRLQLSINELDETGGGHGYRLAGPKFSGTDQAVLSKTLTRHDVAMLRRYLDAVESEETP